jgi:cytochrome P450
MRRTNLYLDPDKLRALKMLAANEDASVSDLVREAIDTLIDRRLHERAAADPRTATTLLDDVLRRIDDKRPPLSQDEIDRDVAEAVSESRSDRTNRRRSASLQRGEKA